jgi:hypothetical protein
MTADAERGRAIVRRSAEKTRYGYRVTAGFGIVFAAIGVPLVMAANNAVGWLAVAIGVVIVALSIRALVAPMDRDPALVALSTPDSIRRLELRHVSPSGLVAAVYVVGRAAPVLIGYDFGDEEAVAAAVLEVSPRATIARPH